MTTATITATYPILYKKDAPVHRNTEAATFLLRSDSDAVRVTIDPNERYVTVEHRAIEVSEEMIGWLRTTAQAITGYPDNLSTEVFALEDSLKDEARSVLASVRYLLSRPEMLDDPLGMAAAFDCKTESGEEFAIPVATRNSWTRHTCLALRDGVPEELQRGLDNGWLPLLGMRHLYRAMQEAEPRFRWIDATIALELCIKEALIRKRPDLETILTELPSPPLEKLYGMIMEETFGKPSPYKNKIKDGATLRNRLVHRPTGAAVTKEQASTYVTMAHQAINHLFQQLYPGWAISDRMLDMTFKD